MRARCIALIESRIGDIAREQPDRSAHWAARTDHRELRDFVDLNRKAELAP
jgi:hypothetical protein